jgi:Family of unknown function (DUF6049)
VRRTALILATLICLSAAPLIESGTAQAATSSDATLRVVQVSPNVPPSTTAVTPLDVTITITNTTSAPMSRLQLQITREPPIASTDDLRQELANPVEGRSQPFRLPSVNLDGDLAPKQTRTVSVTLTTSTDSNATGSLCLCRTGVYPLDFALHASGGSVSGTPERGWTQTYIPSSGDAQMDVSWLWPLIDRPHRATLDATFIDDDLAASVAEGGRLDRALSALEQASSIASVTLVIDPELVDELVVMSHSYRIISATGAIQVGTGGPAAQQWLDRLKAVLAEVAGYSLTPYADPDVDALTRAGMTWATSMPPAMAQRLSTALGITDLHDIAWPAGETVTPAALARLTSSGTRAVLLGSSTLPDSQDSSGGHVVLPNSSATALVQSRDVTAQLDNVVNTSGRGLAAMPELISSAIMPAIDETNNFLVLAPDQWMDVDPAAAAAAIDETVSGPFVPTPARTALATIDTYFGGSLAEPSGAQVAELPASFLATAHTALTTAATVSSALDAADAANLLAGYPEALQRAASAGWRTDRSDGQAFAAGLVKTGNALSDSIRIVPPSGSSYSLASNDSPLLLTIQNSLPVRVSVKVSVISAGDVKGFKADTSAVQSIPAGGQVTVRVQAHVERAGHFVVAASLQTPSGATIGRTQRLSIYSRALGTIGIIITVVAGSVLAIALLIRFTRRFRDHRRRQATLEVPA